MKPENRFILIRGYKTNNRYIAAKRIELLDTIELTRYKLDWKYFLVDFMTNKCISYFNHLTKWNTTGDLTLNIFDEFLSSFDSVDIKTFKSHNALQRLIDTSPTSEIKLYCKDIDDWYMVVSGDNRHFCINPKAFIDFKEYYNRKNKINRVLEEIEGDNSTSL